jgi:hypothetical protein
MESLPPEIALFILKFAGLFRAEVFDSFILRRGTIRLVLSCALNGRASLKDSLIV